MEHVLNEIFLDERMQVQRVGILLEFFVKFNTERGTLLLPISFWQDYASDCCDGSKPKHTLTDFAKDEFSRIPFVVLNDNQLVCTASLHLSSEFF